jgi:predicted TPR repeat methyltransferase
MPDYPAFLYALAYARGNVIRSVLDLACGTGTLAARMATGGREVLGLDASERMLAEARARCGFSQVELVAGDFRDFSLDRRFDAAVCASNSLNYVSEPCQLSDVFRAVAKHLNPGGVFTFDAITGDGMLMLNGVYLHVEIAGARFAIHFRYDPEKRQETSEALLATGVEVHRRVPIEPKDVSAAAAETGLRVEDYFSSAFLPGWLNPSWFYVYVLTPEP